MAVIRFYEKSNSYACSRLIIISLHEKISYHRGNRRKRRLPPVGPEPPELPKCSVPAPAPLPGARIEEYN